MFNILKKQKLAEKTYLMEIEAPEIAKRAKAGQFIMLRIDEEGERIPLTIADSTKKTITIVFLDVGYTTHKLSNMKKGDTLLDFVGPLGKPSLVKDYGSIVLVGGGLGIAPIYPIAKALKKIKNEVKVILGAKSKNHLFWEDKFNEVADEVLIATDDGSKGHKGFVTDIIREIVNSRHKPNLFIAIGPPIMMKMVCKMTRQRVKTLVSLNPLMVDGMGMCGCCRVEVENETKFACVDGPEFNGHKVDWDELKNRNNINKQEEHKCKIGRH